MNLNEFRKKFERLEENQLGVNTNVIDLIIEFIQYSLANCENEDIKFFLDNFDKIDKIGEGFTIFETTDIIGYMYQFKALNLTRSLDMLSIGHEIGHVLNSIKNIITYTDSFGYTISTPDNFAQLLKDAKDNSKKDIDRIRYYIEYLCKDSNISDAEKGPVSDIFSAVYQTWGVMVRSKDNICSFPSTHKGFYDKTKNEEEKLGIIFDECFANIFSLLANNKKSELKIIKDFFGEDFYNIFENEIRQSVQIFRSIIEPNRNPVVSCEKLGNQTAHQLEDLATIEEVVQFFQQEPPNHNKVNEGI